MSTTVFAIVLFAAALHATWNAIVKGASDTLMTTILVTGSSSVIAWLALPFMPPMSAAAWPYLATSGVLEIGYYALVALTYRSSDMSQSYPLMRGTPPVIVALVSALALHETISLAGWIGVGVLCLGILSLSFSSRGQGGRGIGLALVNACIIASYTLVDGFGVRVSGSAATYTMWIFVLAGTPLVLFTLATRARAIAAYAAANWHLGIIGGVGTLVSYGLALWAMTQAPVPIVAALRETSILFGTAIAALVLHERVGPVRIGAVVIIAIGAAILRLA